MKQIRRGVFETNSSSSHSITIEAITNEDMLDTIIPDDDGNIVLEGGEFGWGIEKYSDALTKANYCAVDQLEDGNPNIDMLKRVLKEQTGAEDIIFKFSSYCNGNDYDHAYIDHQSDGTSNEAFVDENTLRNFIFNSNSKLRIDNDNH